MIMMTVSLRLLPLRLLALAAASVAGLLLIGPISPVHAQTVAVMVNGEPITDYDIEQRSKLNFLTTHQQANRQDIINELIHLNPDEAQAVLSGFFAELMSRPPAVLPTDLFAELDGGFELELLLCGRTSYRCEGSAQAAA